MKNAILTLTHNNLALTQKAIWSALRQDVPVEVFAIDNGSTDGTLEWLKAYGWLLESFPDNAGVSHGWNRGITKLLNLGFNPILVIGNDTQLAPWTFRLLDSYLLPFVTGVAVEDMKEIEQACPPMMEVNKHPDFSCFMIRGYAWARVGPFNMQMKHYASDCDFHIRAHRMGIDLYKACVPYYHERSSTIRNASDAERAEIQEQANKDRAVLLSMYGCLPGTAEYEAIFAQSPNQGTGSAPESGHSMSGTGISPANCTQSTEPEASS